MAKKRKGPSKMGMVRDAMATLGKNAKPKAIREYILGKGMDIPTTVISSYKSMIGKKGGKRGRKKGGPGRPKGSGGMGGGGAGMGRSVSISELNAVKDLMGQMGAGKLSDLIRLLS